MLIFKSLTWYITNIAYILSLYNNNYLSYLRSDIVIENTIYMATFPHNYVSKSETCVIAIDGFDYDVTHWRESHPGGAELLDQLHEKDATDVFYALHSQEAIAKLARMSKKPTDMKNAKYVVTPAAKAFREFRKKLDNEGYFKRNWLVDIFYMTLCIAFLALGTYWARSHPVIASFLVGVGIQQAGWLGHDYGHGRGKLCWFMNKIFGNVVLGFSSDWWSHKHNTHHCFPNRFEVDVDIHNEPIIHLWFPQGDSDVWYRRYQHIYYPVAYSFLHVSWRMQSAIFAIGSGDWTERIFMIIGYCWFFSLPLAVMAAAILIGGFLVAIVVTCNHQTEDIIATDAPHCFVTDQFTTTRGVRCDDPITEYLFGGMQYQLEHHLFPTMPRYYFPKLRPVIREFAIKNGLPWKVSSVFEIIRLNYNVIRTYSGQVSSRSSDKNGPSQQQTQVKKPMTVDSAYIAKSKKQN